MKKYFCLLFTIFLLCCTYIFALDFPLKDISFNACTEISGTFLFKFDPSDIGVKEKWYDPDYNHSSWEKISVPGVWNKKPGKIEYPVPSGIGWYYREITIPSSWNQEVLIAFLGSMYTTDVWVNGKYAGIHRGGYTPFFINVTGLVNPGKKAIIVIRVDNQLGRTIPSKRLGWHPFGGIYREVYLIHRDFVHLESIATSVAVFGNQAKIDMQADVVNDSPQNYKGEVLFQLKDKQSSMGLQKAYVQIQPGSRQKVRSSITVKNPRLWCPEDPYLYTAVVSMPYRTIQKIEFPIGLRQFSSKDGGLYLNGKRIWLQGFGNHQEYPGYGPCVNEELIKNDLLIMKNIFKANTLRTGHYPHHPVVFNLCDKLGIIVHTEIPAWQIDRNFIQSDEAWNTWLKGQLEEMVQTFRNHPCVAFWGLSNELYSVPGYHKKAYEFVHSLDPTRFITIVCAATSDLESNKIADIVARNFHYGWYHSQSVYALRDGLSTVLRASENKPIWVAEIGALANSGKYSGGYGDQSRGSETYQDKVVRFGVQYCATQSNQVCGISVWTLSDFHAANGNLLPHGILDEYRKPKILGYTICNLYNGGIRLYVCENDTLIKLNDEYNASLRYFNPDEKRYQNLVAKWCIIKDQKKIDYGSFNFNVSGDRQAEIGRIKFSRTDSPGLYSLWVQLFDSKGNWLYTNSGFFDVKEPSLPGVLKVNVSGKKFKNIKMIYQDIQIPVYEYVGLILPFEQGDYNLKFVADDYKPVSYDVSINSGKATEINIDFKK
ncbi:MAG TPA: glycoside hydrolase family 2 TIM barrel-domain containing protein [Candidatus Ratteibacteria bacterium]|nr:glycoside hydrolase family 2 TIM barrel-domain containing protein [Candidatus Ratteibacteria bacterium]